MHFTSLLRSKIPVIYERKWIYLPYCISLMCNDYLITNMIYLTFQRKHSKIKFHISFNLMKLASTIKVLKFDCYWWATAVNLIADKTPLFAHKFSLSNTIFVTVCRNMPCQRVQYSNHRVTYGHYCTFLSQSDCRFF